MAKITEEPKLPNDVADMHDRFESCLSSEQVVAILKKYDVYIGIEEGKTDVDLPIPDGNVYCLDFYPNSKQIGFDNFIDMTVALSYPKDVSKLSKALHEVKDTGRLKRNTFLELAVRNLNIRCMHESMKRFDKIVVHNGSFHLDDALCVAFAKTLNPNIEVLRLSNEAITDDLINDDKTIICDIGKMFVPEKHVYDHHNDCPTIKGTDIKMSAVGLFLSSDDVNAVYTDCIAGFLKTVQAHDNGIDIDKPNVAANDLSKLADNMFPTWDSDESPDKAFDDFINILQKYVCVPYCRWGDAPSTFEGTRLGQICRSKEAEAELAEQRAESLLQDSLSRMEDNIVVLPKFCPWQKALVPSDAKFVVFPSNRGGYCLRCVPPEVGSMEKKVELPDWSSNAPDGLIYEHENKFTSFFDTKAHAVEAGKLALGLNKDTVSTHNFGLSDDYVEGKDDLNMRFDNDLDFLDMTCDDNHFDDSFGIV